MEGDGNPVWPRPCLRCVVFVCLSSVDFCVGVCALSSVDLCPPNTGVSFLLAGVAGLVVMSV